MKKTSFGIERALYRKIKNMKREELDQYLYKVSSRSESYGYEDGLKNGIALSSKCMDEAIQKAIEYRREHMDEQMSLDDFGQMIKDEHLKLMKSKK
ncbi:MAG: hypothetical protein E7262_09600 [Lachnospiraceae bacterium]|nr:hypothetical protein [Lachnospiraceae bacterium]